MNARLLPWLFAVALSVTRPVAAIEVGIHWGITPAKCVHTPQQSCTYYGPQDEIRIQFGMTNAENYPITFSSLDVLAAIRFIDAGRTVPAVVEWESAVAVDRTSEARIVQGSAADPIVLEPGDAVRGSLRLRPASGASFAFGEYDLVMDLTPDMPWNGKGKMSDTWRIAVRPADTPNTQLKYHKLAVNEFMRTKDFAAAMPHLQAWRRLSPTHPAISASMGRAALALGQFQLAAVELSRFLEYITKRGDCPGQARRSIAVQLAAAHERSGNSGAAEQALLRADFSIDEARAVLERIRRQ